LCYLASLLIIFKSFQLR